MTRETRNALSDLFSERYEVAFAHLQNDLQYIAHCNDYQKNEKQIDAILKQLSKEERIAVRQHIDNNSYTAGYEIGAAYIQGLRDCFQFMGFLMGNQVVI